MLSDAALLAPAATAPLPEQRRPTFSVVIAAYQAADTVGAAVRSALGQTEPPLEVVVADDGSTDDLHRVLQEFGEAVTLLTLPHRGESATKNAGAAASRGDMVVFLDADDTWLPTRLARMGELAQRRPDLELVSTDAWFVVGGERTGRFHGPGHPFPVRDQATELLRRDWVFAGVAVRRAAWERVGGFREDVAYAADWDCWLRIVLSGGVAGCVDEPLVDYVIHEGSLSADRSRSLLARVDVLDSIAATHALTPEQRAAWSAMRSESLRRGRLARAEGALLAGDPSARGACLAYAAAPGLPPRGRAAALAAAIVPRVAAARLRRDLSVTGARRSARSAASVPGRAAPTAQAGGDR